MINTPRDRTRPTDTDAVLELITPIIDRSGIVHTLESAAEPKSAAGAPTRHGQYTARGVLIAMFHAAYAGRPASIAELIALIWMDYTDEQLALIGMPSLRTPERLTALMSDDRAWRNEHQRLWQYLHRLLQPMDDTARPANARFDKDANAAAQESAEKTFGAEADLRRKVLNDLITATIDPTLLSDWRGDLAIDEHVVHVSKPNTRYFDGKGSKASATPMASFYKKQNRVGEGWSVGLTRAVTTSRPRDARVPTLCVALDINGSSPGDIQAALRCLDEFGRTPLRPTKQRNERTHLVTDMGYSRTIIFNTEVLKRGYTLLMRYPNTTRLKFVHDLGRTVDDEATEPGPYMYYGGIVCPAAQQLVKTRTLAPTHADTDAHAARFKAEQEALQRLQMPLNGLPQVTVRRAKGRPKKNSGEEQERVVKLRVQCPAAKGKVRCAIRSTIDDDGAYGDPRNRELPDVSATAPVDHWPKVCDKATTTMVLTEHQFSQYQPVMEGSWEHQDWMSSNRSRDEGFNSILTSTEGGNLQDRTLYARRNPQVSLTIAFAVARANIKIQERWRETLRRNGGKAPREPQLGSDSTVDRRMPATRRRKTSTGGRKAA
ncbi:hypothetical protein [Knoellia sp. LjRoot47]|uniref:hypothetical protein n=1 Tax=Knoellia sp. LjRoot47 TaxID=3342330 RepID=UPI003ECDF6B6